MSTSEPMADPAPDPVAQPSEYRDLLLSLAGSDDPASVQRATAGELRDLLTQAGEHGVLRTPPAPGEWSMIELAGHFVDAELVSSARYRWIVAHYTPDIAAYDQDLWVSRLRHREAGPEELLDLFEAPPRFQPHHVGANPGTGTEPVRRARRTRPGVLRGDVPHACRPRPVPLAAGSRDAGGRVPGLSRHRGRYEPFSAGMTCSPNSSMARDAVAKSIPG